MDYYTMEGNVSPTPLFFRTPKDVLNEAMSMEDGELGPDFLCFEAFYQAVAATWPRSYTVVDVGGYMGVQGWLFRDFERYVCVDMVDVMHRARLPMNGRHVVSEGCQYIEGLREFEGATNVSHDGFVFLCSAVQSPRLRVMVSDMPNNVVWYPGRQMTTSGPFGHDTKREFARIRGSHWAEKKDAAIMAAIGETWR